MADDNHKIGSPPVLAVLLLSLAVNAEDRPVLLGDLHEEFGQRSKTSHAKARSWYWRQALLSAPHLVRTRMLHNAAFSAAAIFTVSALSFAFIYAWDVFVARKCAQFLALHLLDSPLLMIRLVYFLIMLAGVAMVGSLIARYIFFEDYSFRKNAATRLLPTAFLLVAAAIVTWVSTGGNLPASYLVLRVGLAISALVFGALMVVKNRTL